MQDTISPPGWVHALPGRLRVKVVSIKKALVELLSCGPLEVLCALI